MQFTTIFAAAVLALGVAAAKENKAEGYTTVTVYETLTKYKPTTVKVFETETETLTKTKKVKVTQVEYVTAYKTKTAKVCPTTTSATASVGSYGRKAKRAENEALYAKEFA